MDVNAEAKTEATRVRERDYIVKWMRGIIAGMTSISERRAFMAKLNTICTYHQISLDELLEQDR